MPLPGSGNTLYTFRSVQQISTLDGTSNTIICGHKYMQTTLYANPDAAGYINVGNTLACAVGSFSYNRDSTTAAVANGGWGGPFSSGGLFVFADGNARSIPFSFSTNASWPLMLRPDDG